jgi:predicted acyl esterase
MPLRPVGFRQAEAMEIRLESDVQVHMRDGVRLATDIWIPRAQPAPVLLVRRRIGKNGSRISHGCVRLPDSELLKRRDVPPGTPIDVID